jgi:hypothetical protein
VAVPKEGILRPVQVKEEIRLNDIYQLAISFVKTSKEEQDDGFYLAVDYIKAYRKQQEPEFIMISCTDVGKYLRPEKLKVYQSRGNEQHLTYMNRNWKRTIQSFGNFEERLHCETLD